MIYNSGEVNSPPRGTSASAYWQEINDGDACYRYLQYGTPTLRELYSWRPCLDLDHDVLCGSIPSPERIPSLQQEHQHAMNQHENEIANPRCYTAN